MASTTFRKEVGTKHFFSMKSNLFILLLLFSLNTKAQMKALQLWDFASADCVAWVKVTHGEIIDTTGFYTNQKIKIEPITILKGEMPQDSTFHAWLETQTLIWKEGSLQGFFLKQVVDQERSDKAQWYWIENSGFLEEDIPFLKSLNDQKSFKEAVGQMYKEDEREGAWTKAKILSKPALGDLDAYELGFKCKLALQEKSQFFGLTKGKTIEVIIIPDVYSNTHESLSKFQIGEGYDFYIYKSEEGLIVKEEFILK